MVSRKQGSGHPKKIIGKFSKSLEQSIWRDKSVSIRTLAKKLCQMGLKVSHVTVSRYLGILDYNKSLPRVTLMLTTIHKQKHIK